MATIFITSHGSSYTVRKEDNLVNIITCNTPFIKETRGDGLDFLIVEVVASPLIGAQAVFKIASDARNPQRLWGQTLRTSPVARAYSDRR